MYIINEWIQYLNNRDETRDSLWEYELKCRIHLIGVIDLGWAIFRFWEMPPKRSTTDVRSVVLRMRYRNLSVEDHLKLPNKKEQHYHPSGPAGEFESLITLFTRAHFVLVKGSDLGEMPLLKRFSNQESVAYSDVDGSEIKLGEIQKYFDMMREIRAAELDSIRHKDPSDRYIKRFIMAARFYHLALPLINQDATLAYICLVSAIECMLDSYKAEEFGLDVIIPEAHKLLSDAVPDPKQRKDIEDAILVYPSKKKWRFARFIHDHLSNHFWDDENRPAESFRFRDAEEIRIYMLRVYDARSSAVHAGEPLPNVDSYGMQNIERILAQSMQIGEKRWSEKEMIPSARAFERLVHHVLLESLRKRYVLIRSSDN